MSELLVPSCGAWWGVDPGALTDIPKVKALDAFERKIGRPVDIYHAFHRGSELFPTKKEIAIARKPGAERLLLLNWKPGIDYTWAEIAAGEPAVDKQIDRLADHINRVFPQPFFLTIYHEPENDVVPRSGSGYTAKDYRAMFRYVVNRLQQQGVDNAVIVMNYMGSPKWCTKPWFGNLYPGDDVVDWIAFDPYAESGVDNFVELINSRYPPYMEWQGFYRWVHEKYPDTPLMLAEWGVFAQPDDPDHKARIFRSVARSAPKYPQIKAYVYFSSPDAGKGDTSIDTTKAALEAYRKMSQMPYFNPPGPNYEQLAQ